MKSKDLKTGGYYLLKKGIFIHPWNTPLHRIVKIKKIFNQGGKAYDGLTPYFVGIHHDKSFGESAYQIGNIERELNEEEVRQYEVENEI